MKPTYEELEQRVRELEAVCSPNAQSQSSELLERVSFRAVLNTIEDGINVVTPDLLMLYANDNLKKMVSNQNLVGRICHEALLGRTSPCANCPVLRSFKSGLTETEEIVLRNGIILELRSSPVELPSGQRAAIELCRDISLRKAAEAAAQTEKEKFRVLVEKSPLGVSLVGEDGRYKYINPKFTEIFGYALEDIPSGRKWFSKAWPDPNERAEVVSLWVKDHDNSRPGELFPRVLRASGKDGSKKTVNFRSVILESGEVLVIYEDITERKRLEAQLFRAQRMEATGTLAGGIAHDFNNLLMGVQGNTSLMLLETDPSHSHYERLKNIEQYIKSGADLTRQLLGFAKGGKYEVKTTNLNETLDMAANMFGRTKKEIVIHKVYEEELWTVDVDRAQIQQVLMNFFVNAWQAMPAGGDLYLQTENVVLDDIYVKPYQASPGKYVKASVTDTGVGMDEATRRRIFDPFFTTKGLGRGTGLGLASAYGIIQNHGGIINVYSEKGQGATFNIYLPVSGHSVKKEEDPVEGILGGDETLLLVDDEESIVEVGEDLLTKLGYKVLTAKGGQEALKVFNERRTEIAMVILDMIMPDMGGGVTYAILKGIDPKIKVLLSSGYSINGQATEILKQGCSGFIQKPFNIQQLSQAVRKILDNEEE